MKVPLRWLRDYVDWPLSVAQLTERLTLLGLEVAGVRPIGLPMPDGIAAAGDDVGPVWDPKQVVIGRVLAVERHPNADRLTLVNLEYGASQPKTVVTGAPNIKVGDQGQKVIVALTGAVLFDGHAEQKVLRELKPSKIRGVASDAMVCSSYELGISEEHEGIILLEDDAPVGMPLAEYMGDIVIEIDVLPNMARCLSIIGIAREVAALSGTQIKLPSVTLAALGPPIAGKVDVAIEDAALSRRYAAALIEGVRIGVAPGWMQRRLTYAGMRPISNIVDITNYVMLEWGQPLHAFDFDLLKDRAGGKTPLITVRAARARESLKTLDGVERQLSPDNLVIADARGPIALAGVMGGADTEVTAQTKNILLESANFDLVSIRRTMRALNLPSEASVRFSKGVPPENVQPAALRAAQLMEQLADGTVCKGLVDRYPAPLPARVVELHAAEVRRVLGIDVSLEEMQRVLRSLEFKVEAVARDRLRVTVPGHRLDIQEGSADLIEELVRIHGYDRLPASMVADQLPEQHGDQALRHEERIRDLLVDCGLQEVITYALTEPARESPLHGDTAEYVRLLNPITSDRVVMRRTILGGMLEVAAANLRNTSDVCMFEIGSVYLPRAGEKLPDEPRQLGLLMTGRRDPEFWGEPDGSNAPVLEFFDIKGVIEALVEDLHVPGITYRPSQASYLHPARSGDLLLGERLLGSFGQLHPRTATVCGLGERTVLAGELDLNLLLPAIPARYAYTAVPRFPAALRDIAVIVEEALTSELVVKEMRIAGGDLLRGIRLFDLYRGDSIPAGTKSLAYALTYQADDRTLTDKEVDKAHKKIEDRLRHVLKAQIRGQE